MLRLLAMKCNQADAQSCAPGGAATRNPLNKLVERVFDTAGRHALPPFLGPMAPQHMQAETGAAALAGLDLAAAKVLAELCRRGGARLAAQLWWKGTSRALGSCSNHRRHRT